MTRSQDPRDKLPSQRGAKRTGPIGTILPGDHTEVARDIQRIWLEISRCHCRQKPSGDSGEFTTYSDLIMAHPCLAHYWPADEASGSLVDRKGTWPLNRATHSWEGNTWPRYGQPGPFVGFPALTSVENDGLQGILNDHHGAFHYSEGGVPLPFWGGDFTIECWVYVTAYASAGVATLFNVSPGLGAGDHIRLFLFPSAPQQMFFGRSETTISDPEDFTLNAWQHVVGRYDGTNIDLFLNGIQVATAAESGSFVSGAFVTWMNGIDGYEPFRGRVAHMALYNCAISDATILSHKAAQTMTGNPDEGYVLTADGVGGSSFLPPAFSLPDPLPEIPATPTAQDIADALVALGLATQL